MQNRFSIVQLVGIIGAAVFFFSFFALPWYSGPAHNAGTGWMDFQREQPIQVTGYQFSQLHGVLWLVPIGVAFILMFIVAAPRIGVKASKILAIKCGILPFGIYALIAGIDLQRAGIGLIIIALGAFVAIVGVCATKAAVSVEKES